MSEECRTAFQAALELIEEKCGISFPKGGARRVDVSGTTVLIPEEVSEMAEKNPKLTREERITAVSESEWAQSWAKGMLNLVSPGLMGKERDEAITRLSRTLAERVV